MPTQASPSDSSLRYSADALRRFALGILRRTGLTNDQAKATAEVLVEGDLLGHSTHGLQLLMPYVRAIESGAMQTEGVPLVLADHPAAITWDGRFLPGPWLVQRALDLALERIAAQPVVTVVIRRSHHIGCLAAYLQRATDRGLLMLLSCSDPSVRSVAPHGALAGRYTPNPLAAGFPTNGDPVLLDVSMSTTTNGLTARMNRTRPGDRLPGPWLVDADGQASDDPAVMQSDPPGAILPLGGIDLGHKGFALGLLVEALTAGLGGHGRADGESQWGASVFLQLLEPATFGGRDRFVRETGWLAQACRTAPVRPGSAPVRLPGERALALKREQLAHGIALHPETMPTLEPLARRWQMALPEPLAGPTT